MPTIIPDSSLPAPWLALQEAGSKSYFFNPQTSEVTWKRPVSATEQHRPEGGVPRPSSEPSQAASDYRASKDIRCEVAPGESIPDPVTSFESAGFSADILNEINRAGFMLPTPVQAQTWPVALSGRDLIGIAKTGSGKTCGFLLPAMMHIFRTRKDARMGPTALVLAPTRELAVQTKTEADKFGRSSRIRNTCVYGGAPKGPQLHDLRMGVEIVIATPGRLNDYLESGLVQLGQVTYLVLDEADRMLDMGFEPQIQRIVAAIPEASRQTLFFSATWPREVQSIASQFVRHHPVRVFIGGVDTHVVANTSITQRVEVLGEHEKLQHCAAFLRSMSRNDRVMIFCTTKRQCDQLGHQLWRDFRAAAIHGDKRQFERDSTLAAFKSGACPVLVATDVAARGLDIPHVRAVLNYDFPANIEDYVHRIGRTGRAGASGEALTYMTYGDARLAAPLIRLMKEANQVVPRALEDLAASAPRGGGGGRSRYAPRGGRGTGYGGGSGDFRAGAYPGGPDRAGPFGRGGYCAPAGDYDYGARGGYNNHGWPGGGGGGHYSAGPWDAHYGRRSRSPPPAPYR